MTMNITCVFKKTHFTFPSSEQLYLDAWIDINYSIYWRFIDTVITPINHTQVNYNFKFVILLILLLKSLTQALAYSWLSLCNILCSPHSLYAWSITCFQVFAVCVFPTRRPIAWIHHLSLLLCMQGSAGVTVLLSLNINHNILWRVYDWNFTQKCCCSSLESLIFRK